MEKMDVGKVADELKERIKDKANAVVGERGTKPKLAIIRVGTDWASVHYETSLLKKCDMYGLDARVFTCLHSTPFETFKRHWKQVNDDSSVNGILLLQPLPESYDIEWLMDTIDPRKDIDCFGTRNKALLYTGRKSVAPCTSQAVMEVIESFDIFNKMQDTNACLIGRSEVVGKPLAQLLLNKNITFTINHSKTPKSLLEKNCRNADVIISCTGAGNLITADMVKEGAIILDVGMKELESGELIGDLYLKDCEVKGVHAHYTPVRGGIGAITSLCLLERVCDSAISLIPKEKQEKIKRVYATNKNGDKLLAFDMPFCNEVEK